MDLEVYKIWGQIYPLPTLKITHDRMLNGYHEIHLMWFGWGVCLMFNEKKFNDK